MASTKDIQRRIKSIKSTRKITKAMQLVAAAKMKRAVATALTSRTYANLAWMILLNLTRDNVYKHDLLMSPEKLKQKANNKIAIVLYTSNKGLCGGFNSNVINKVLRSMQKYSHQETDFYLFGTKGKTIISRYNCNVVSTFSKTDNNMSVSEIIPVANTIIEDYLAKKYDKIFVAFTDFVSTLKQEPRIKQILPIDIRAHADFLSYINDDSKLYSKDNAKMPSVTESMAELLRLQEEEALCAEFKHEAEWEKLLPESMRYSKYKFQYTYEPGQQEVLDKMLPRLIEVQLYQAMLESNASEQSSRMLAMKNATDAASDLIDELVLSYNKARQASITAEIAEISAGAAAISSDNL